MASLSYPTNIDATYSDPTTDAGDHQRFHDGVHTVVNRFDNVAGSAGQVLWWDGSVGLYVPHTLLSTDIPGVVINSQSGTSYTLVLTDAGKTVLCTNASAVTLTVPTNASVAFPVGSVVSLYQMGAGQVTVAGAGGVTLNSRGGALKTAGQYAPAALLKTATDVWVVSGDVTA